MRDEIYTLERQPVVAWPERVAIAIGILLCVMIGAVYAFFGVPGAFYAWECTAAGITIALWMLMRLAKFVSGR